MLFLKTFLVSILLIIILNAGEVTSQQSQNQNQNQNNLGNILTVLASGGAGVGSSVALNKSSKAQQNSVAEHKEDYKNSPSYLKEKISELKAENEKLKNSVDSLRRRYHYIDTKLARLHPEYISYEDRVPPKATQ